MASLIVSSSSRNPGLSVSSFPSPGRRRKYYVVSVGKRTGVFDNWSVLLSYLLLRDLFIFIRPYVHKLTSGVSGSCQKSYATYDEARGVYLDLKEQGLVRVVRDPGDDVAFGLLEDAVQ